VSELSEIALIRAMDAEISITGIFDPNSSLDQLLSKPVWTDLAEVGDFDMCLLTNLTSPYEFYKSLVSEIGKDRVLIPDVLGMSDLNEKIS
jgi:hypothetical protein